MRDRNSLLHILIEKKKCCTCSFCEINVYAFWFERSWSLFPFGNGGLLFIPKKSETGKKKNSMHLLHYDRLRVVCLYWWAASCSHDEHTFSRKTNIAKLPRCCDFHRSPAGSAVTPALNAISAADLPASRDASLYSPFCTKKTPPNLSLSISLSTTSVLPYMLIMT